MNVQKIISENHQHRFKTSDGHVYQIYRMHATDETEVLCHRLGRNGAQEHGMLYIFNAEKLARMIEERKNV